MAPIYELQKERLAAAKADATALEAELERAKAEFERVRKNKDSSAAELQAALEIRKQAEAALANPALLVVDDITAEALANDLAQNPRLLIASAEGGLLDTFLGRYQHGTSNLDLLNKAWSGESHTVRRVSHRDGGVFVETRPSRWQSRRSPC